MEESENKLVMLQIRIPKDLLDWLDLHLAELRVQLVRARKNHLVVATRAGFIRNNLQEIRRKTENK